MSGMLRYSVLFAVFVVATSFVSCSKSEDGGNPPVQPPNPPPQEQLHLRGLCYGPFRDGESPEHRIFPTPEEMEADLRLIARFADKVRTYGVGDTLGLIPGICQQLGLQCYPGAWLSIDNRDNEAEITALQNLAAQGLDAIKGLIVGNEVLLREDMSVDELIGYIRRVAQATDIPVTTAEPPQSWLNNPQLADEVDFILVHLHPYWDGSPIGQAVDRVMEQYGQLQARFPGKRIVIGETGWPSAGEVRGQARPSPENLRAFLVEFVQRAQQAGLDYFYFEAFDEQWKATDEGTVGAHWGLYESGGELKSVLTGLLPAGINRPRRVVEAVNTGVPLVVWAEPDQAAFWPSGWMGTMSAISMTESNDNPHSGATCLQISFQPVGNVWARIYWQYPLNNWGDYPGYSISGASRLVFWARGRNGGEKAEFKAGGIDNRDRPYRDSFGPVSTGVVTLSKNWRRYEIALAGRDLSNVIGGFCWVTNYPQNPTGATIFLDDIVIE